MALKSGRCRAYSITSCLFECSGVQLGESISMNAGERARWAGTEVRSDLDASSPYCYTLYLSLCLLLQQQAVNQALRSLSESMPSQSGIIGKRGENLIGDGASRVQMLPVSQLLLSFLSLSFYSSLATSATIITACCFSCFLLSFPITKRYCSRKVFTLSLGHSEFETWWWPRESNWWERLHSRTPLSVTVTPANHGHLWADTHMHKREDSTFLQVCLLAKDS